MIAVCEIVNIEPGENITFSDGSRHRVMQVWCKSSDEELQGNWTTFVKLYDEKISENEGIKVGDTVSLSIIPTSRRLGSGSCVQSIIIKLTGAA